MNNKMKNRAIKTKARIVLRGHYEIFALMVLLYGGIRLACILIPAFIFQRGNPVFIMVMNIIVPYLFGLISSMFAIGITKAALSVSREGSLKFSDIIYAFTNQSNQFIKLEMILSGIATCLSLPAIFLYYFRTINVLGLILLGLLASFISLLLTIKLRFARYVLIDQPGCTLTDALKESFFITNGNFLRILKLILSFIPMYLLGAASLATGFLVIMPYMETSYAVIYDEICRR